MQLATKSWISAISSSCCKLWQVAAKSFSCFKRLLDAQHLWNKCLIAPEVMKLYQCFFLGQQLFICLKMADFSKILVMLQSLEGCCKAFLLLQKVQHIRNKSLNASEVIVMLFQFVFVIGQLPFCFRMADLSDFRGCCKFQQVAAKPFGCFKTFKIDQ